METGIFYTLAVLLILGGILAISGLIVAKKPDAKAIIDKLTPFQALIGVGMLAVGLYVLIKNIKVLPEFFKNGLPGFTIFAMMATAILLGFLFGMPQIAGWIPGESSAENKAVELSKKLAPFQVILGIVGLAATLLGLLYQWKVIKP